MIFLEVPLFLLKILKLLLQEKHSLMILLDFHCFYIRNCIGVYWFIDVLKVIGSSMTVHSHIFKICIACLLWTTCESWLRSKYKRKGKIISFFLEVFSFFLKLGNPPLSFFSENKFIDIRIFFLHSWYHPLIESQVTLFYPYGDLLYCSWPVKRQFWWRGNVYMDSNTNAALYVDYSYLDGLPCYQSWHGFIKNK